MSDSIRPHLRWVVAMLDRLRESWGAPVVLAAIVAAVLGLASKATLDWLNRPPPPSPAGQILSPVAGNALEASFTAHGTLDHLPEDGHVWLAVQRGNEIWPKQPEVRADRAWVHEFVEVEFVKGQTFSLILLLAREEGQAAIVEWFATGELGGEYPGLDVARLGNCEQLDVVTDLSLAAPHVVSGSISGVVTDLESGQALAGVTVTAGDLQTVTDDAGAYKFEGLEPGDYVLVAAAGDYASATRIIEVVANDTFAADLILAPLGPASDLDQQQEPIEAEPLLVINLSAVTARGDGEHRSRSEASDGTTLLLHDGEAATFEFELSAVGEYQFVVRYSNDNNGPSETVTLRVDGTEVGQFAADDTGEGGFGWNVFLESPSMGPHSLGAKSHELRVDVDGGDGYGIEIDRIEISLA